MRFLLLFLFSSVGLALGASPSVCTTFKNLYERPGSKECLEIGFDLTGQIFLINGNNDRLITLVDKETPFSMQFLDMSSRTNDYHCGNLVHVRGNILPNSGAFTRESSANFILCITNLQILGNAPMPATHETTARQINNSEVTNTFIRIKGVLSAITRDNTNSGWNWLTLRTSTGNVHAALTEADYPYQALVKLLDAEVELRGIVNPPEKYWSIRGTHVIPFGHDGLRLIKPAGQPFSVPWFWGGTIALHRQKVMGEVIGANRDNVFLRDIGGHFLPLTLHPGTCRPAIGDPIIASGFLEKGPMCIQMTDAVIQRKNEPKRPILQAQPTDSEKMFTSPNGNSIVDASYYGKVIKVRGRISNSRESIRADKKILLESGKRMITIDIDHLPNSIIGQLGNDYVIDVSGICLFEFDPIVTNMTFPQFKGFVIVPRTAEDIVIVRRPPWWTVGKLICVIAVLALGLVAVFIWNRMLKLLSERRGRELAEEQITSARADLKVEERTRLAVELHDSISQTLTGVALQIDAAQGSGRSNPTAAAKFLENARAMLVSCRQELRCCIWDLKSRTFEEKDMTEAMQKTLAPHINEANLYVRFNVPRAILSESSAHDILRIVRELVINAIRHGQAKNIRIAGECRDGTVRFSVKDDGIGFSEANLPGPSQGHFGLQGIRERIGNRNGSLEIDSTPGQGTKVTVSLEADEDKDQDGASA